MLITEYYKNQNKALHLSDKRYGHRGHTHIEKIEELIKEYECEDVLDYGCGMATLSKHAEFPVINYDPAVDEYAEDPIPCDLLVCTDVLEHIEPNCLHDVLKHIRSKMKKAGYLVVNTREDISKTLPDGTNPHKIIQPYGWWTKTLKKYFKIEDRWQIKHHVYYVIS